MFTSYNRKEFTLLLLGLVISGLFAILWTGPASATPDITISVFLNDEIVNPGQTIVAWGIAEEDGAPLDNRIVRFFLDGAFQTLSWGMPSSAPWEAGIRENTIIEANRIKLQYKPDMDIVFIDENGYISWVDPYREVKTLGVYADKLGGAGDIDGDGKIDVVFTDGPQGALKYVDVDNNIRTLVASGVINVAKGLADFDGDGKLDVPYVTTAYDYKIYFIDYEGRIRSVGPLPIHPLLLGGVGDFDNDGKPEVSFGYMSDIRHVDIDGQVISMGGSVQFHQTDRRSDISQAADFNGDGRLDVAYNPPSAYSDLWITDNRGNVRQVLPTGNVFGGLGTVGGMGDFYGDGRIVIAYKAFFTSTGNRYTPSHIMVVDNTGRKDNLGVRAKYIGPIVDFDMDTGYVPSGSYRTPVIDWRSPTIRIENITLTVAIPVDTRLWVNVQVSDDNFSTIKDSNLLVLTPGMGGIDRTFPLSLKPARYARVIFSFFTDDLSRTAVLTSFTLNTNIVTLENGWYMRTFEAPSTLGTHQVKFTVERYPYLGENTKTFDVRRLVFEPAGLLDEHGQIDNILNPGERYYVLVKIQEENGTHRYDVTSGSFIENIGGTLYSLIYLENSIWRTSLRLTAPTTIGTYSFGSTVSGYSAENIIGSGNVTHTYYVKTLEIQLFFERSWVNPGDNVTIYGRVKKWPDNVWVEDADVDVYVAGNYVATVRTQSGENAGRYEYTFQAPRTLGGYPVRVWISHQGLDRENTSTFYVKTLTITVDMDPASHQVRPGVKVRIYGVVRRWPEGTPASYATVKLRMGPLDNYENINWPVADNIARADGSYDIYFTVRDEWVGEFKLVVIATDNYLLENENSTWMLSETIKISVYFSRSNVPPGTLIYVWGWAIFQPSGVPVSNNPVSIWKWEGADEDATFTDENGRYEYYFYAPQNWGNYNFRVRTSKAGLTGENVYPYKVSTILISLNIDDKIVNKGQEINISGRAALFPDNLPVGNTVFRYSVGWRPGYSYTRTDENGNYTFVETAPSAIGRYTIKVEIAQGDFSGENADNIETRDMLISVSLSKTKAIPGERVRVSGLTTVLLPGGENRPPPGGTRVDIYIDDEWWAYTYTDTSGYYWKDINAPDVGPHEVKVVCADNENIIGENVTYLYVERILISVNVDRDPSNPGAANRVWGYAWFQYSGDPVENYVQIRLNGVPIATVMTNRFGYYENNFTSPTSLGEHRIDVTMLHENFRGDNTRWFWVRTLDIPVNLSDKIVRSGQYITVSGRITVQPGGWPVPQYTVVRIYPSWTSPIITSTGPDGTYTAGLNAPATLGIHTIRVEAEEGENGIMGSRENTIEVRELRFSEFKLVDNHGQEDRIMNPGESYRLFIRIQEFNGASYFDVEETHPSNPFKVTIAGQDYTLAYTGSSGIWRTPYLTAESSLGMYVVSAFFSGSSANDIYGSQSINYTYDVKTIWLSLVIDNVVNPMENTTISGRAILLPDDTPVKRENVFIFKEDELLTIVQTDWEGYFGYSFVAPDLLENYFLKVRITDANGIERENSRRQWVKTIEISIFLGEEVVGISPTDNVYGWVILHPDNIPQSGLAVRIFGTGLDNEQTVYTNDEGYYFLQFNVSAYARNYGFGEVRVQVRNADNIYNENSATYYVGTPVNVRGWMKNAEGKPLPATFEFTSISKGYTLRISVKPDGTYSGVIIKDDYHMTFRLFGHSITFYSVRTFSGAQQWENFDNLIRIDNIPRSAAYVSDNVNTIFAIAIEIDNKLADNFQTATIILDYTPWLGMITNESNLAVYKASWDMARRENTSKWTRLGGTINKVDHTITLSGVTKFSAYVVGESVPSMQDVVGPIVGPLVGPIVGPLRGPIPDYSGTLRKIMGLIADIQTTVENLPTLENLPQTPPVEVTPSPSAGVSLDMYPGETAKVPLSIKNNSNVPIIVTASKAGQTSAFISFEEPYITVQPGDVGKVMLVIYIPENTQKGLYTGSVFLYPGVTQPPVEIPVKIRVLSPARSLLDVRISSLLPSVNPGKHQKAEVTLYNMGEEKRVDAVVRVQLIDPDTLAVLNEVEETMAVETSLSRIFSLKVPENAKEKYYYLKALATYQTGENREMQASALASMSVIIPFWDKTTWGISNKIFYSVIAAAIAAGTAGYLYYRRLKKLREAQKRYERVLSFTELPQPGPRSAFIGKLAETPRKAYLYLDDLRTHAIVAGATGAGKTIMTQDLAEEAIMHGIDVFVFDPTAQWTGMLQKCTEHEMLRHYDKFGMKERDAAGFPGYIKRIKDPTEYLNLGKLLKRPKKEGEMGRIWVFLIDQLDSRDLDVFIANTINDIFKSNPEESQKLRALIIFDEVHRLLPRFGGKGLGITMLERAVREFRKWGIGLVLASQVIADFEKEIRANIRTQIQLWTRDEEELERIKEKFGLGYMQSVAKAAVGTGMVFNSDYNKGRPYFIHFRPILHRLTRLEEDVIIKWDKYTRRLEELQEKLDKLREAGADIFDLEIELGLARKKLEEGAFDVVDLYLESVEPRIDKECKARKIEIKKVRVTEEELKKAEMEAKKERVKAEKAEDEKESRKPEKKT
ncbi:MAG: helicase HerA-like domain-containing protein [Candidatus Hadarchaeales archaeon]